MKSKSLIALTVAGSLLIACAGEAPRKDVDPKRKIQTIALSGRAHLYAQDDILLTRSSVDKELSKMNDQWKSDLSTSRAYNDAGIATLVAELASLIVCVGQDNLANVLGWCSGSIVMGVATYIFMGEADKYRFQAIDQYNHSARAGLVPLLEQESASRQAFFH